MSTTPRDPATATKLVDRLNMLRQELVPYSRSIPDFPRFSDVLQTAAAALASAPSADTGLRRALPPIEHVAAAVHDSWMATKRASGVTSRLSESGEELMVPYGQLSDAAKKLDRATVESVYAALAASPAPSEPWHPEGSVAKALDALPDAPSDPPPDEVKQVIDRLEREAFADAGIAASTVRCPVHGTVRNARGDCFWCQHPELRQSEPPPAPAATNEAELLQYCYEALKDADSLRNLGFNERHSQDKSPDETGTTHEQYVKAADKLERKVHQARDRLRYFLRATPAPPAGCGTKEPDAEAFRTKLAESLGRELVLRKALAMHVDPTKLDEFYAALDKLVATPERDGVAMISAERQRQSEKEGWTPEHDDLHKDDALALAAAAYSVPVAFRGAQVSLLGEPQGSLREFLWRWSPCDWKPTPRDRIRELAKAGALVAAEIDRLQRLAAASARARDAAEGERRQGREKQR